MKLPKYLSDLINLIEKDNYQVFLVGGAIRDYLLNISNHDFDLATNMPYEKIVSLCNKNKLRINTQGEKHETVGILYKHNYVEVTCFRGLDKDKLSQDLKLRDFTFNSLAYNRGNIIDVTSGIDDLKNKIIKSYKPDTVFSVDPLRILRMYRFVAKYNFNIDKDTHSWAKKEKDKLSIIAKERILSELNKILIFNPLVTILMAEDKIIDTLFLDINLNIKIDNFSKNINNYFISKIIKKKNLGVNYFLFFLAISNSFDISLEELIKFFHKKYKFSNDLYSQIKKLMLSYNSKFLNNNYDNLFYLINNLKFDLVDLNNLFIINLVISSENKLQINQIKKLYLEKKKKGEVIFLSDIDINGDEIISLTRKKGKEIGEIKKDIYKKCFYLLLNNKKEDIIQYLKTI